jgi:hypothetical protein
VRHVRMLGLCLTAMFVVAAVAAVGASASLPEWGGCEPTPRGKYTDGACVHKAAHRNSAEGKYEWYTGEEFGRVNREVIHEPPTQLKHYWLEGHSGTTIFSTTSGKAITCGAGTENMQLQNPETETIGGQEERPTYEIHGSTKGVKQVFMTFTECESEGQPCTSNNSEEGDVSNEGAWIFETGEDPIGKVGFVNSEKGEVGLSLTTIAKTTKDKKQVLFKANCKGEVGTVEIGGETQGKNAVISLIAPTNTMTTAFTQIYSQGAPGEQVPSSFEGKHEEALRAFLSNEGIWEKLGLSATFAVHREGGAEPPIEIKTEP